MHVYILVGGFEWVSVTDDTTSTHSIQATT